MPPTVALLSSSSPSAPTKSLKVPRSSAEDALLFTLAKTSDGAEMWDKAEIVVQSLASGTRKSILRGTDARYVPTGHLLYAVSGVVFAIPFDAKRQEVSGAAVPVIEGVRRSTGAVRGPRTSSRRQPDR